MSLAACCEDLGYCTTLMAKLQKMGLSGTAGSPSALELVCAKQPRKRGGTTRDIKGYSRLVEIACQNTVQTALSVGQLAGLVASAIHDDG